jgi:hypothetical protein
VKVTAPESCTGPEIGVTIAVKITESWKFDGFFTMDGVNEDATAVLLAIALTVCVNMLLLVLNSLSLA